MKRRALPRLLFAVALLFAVLSAAAQVAVPPLKARVTDLTATLSAEQRAELEQKLAAFEARKGSQIAVLLIPTTQPEAIEQYAIRAAEEWVVSALGVELYHAVAPKSHKPKTRNFKLDRN